MLIKTSSLKNGDYDVECEYDVWFSILRDLALLIYKADYSYKGAIIEIPKDQWWLESV